MILQNVNESIKTNKKFIELIIKYKGFIYIFTYLKDNHR
jgi:hypothetical protein